MKIKNRNILLGLTISILFISIYFIGVNYYRKPKILEQVKLNTDNKNVSNNIAIMIQKEDGSGYEKSDTFPVGYVLNNTLSGCIDSYGNDVSGIINYDKETTKLKLKLNSSSYCYLYFDANLYDIETNILVMQDNGSYKNVYETPIANDIYQYKVRYDCTNNDGIIDFNYDYTTNKYRFVSSSKNKCNIYFDERIPDIKIIIYVNGKEIDELDSSETYTLDETLSTCTNGVVQISYDDTTKKVKIISNKKTTCNVYLKGV